MGKGMKRLQVAIGTMLILGTGIVQAEAKLGYRQRQAVDRQERNMADIEKKIKTGDVIFNGSTKWLIKKLDATMEDLTRNKAPADHTRVAALMSRVAAARTALAGTAAAAVVQSPPAAPPAKSQAEGQQAPKSTPPKLAPSARAAVDRQWKKLQQQKANLMALIKDIEKATVLKKWNDRLISFKLQGVMEDLDKNRVPKDHPYYIKIQDLRTNLLTSLENVKANAEPKIAAYANATNLDNYPEIQADIKRADELAHLYQNVGTRELENPAKAQKLLGPAAQISTFIRDSRLKYAPLIEHNMGPGNSLETKLAWLEKNFAKFQVTQETFIKAVPAQVDKMLVRASVMSSKAKAQKKPLFFTGGVRQALDQATALVDSLTLAKGKDAPLVKAQIAKLQEAKSQAAEIAKLLETEILAANRAPKAAFAGSGGKGFVDQMRKEWTSKNPDDQILDVRIPSKDWERSVGYDWNSGYQRWEKYDRQWLQMAVIVRTDDQIATVYPAFINRDNMSKKESLVASHQSTYEIRRILIKNLD